MLCHFYIISGDDDVPDIYTVEEAVDKLGFGAFQVFMSIFAGTIWVAYVCIPMYMYLGNTYIHSL